MYDGIMRELKNVRYIPRMMKNLISVRALEAEGLRETLGESVLKMSSSSLVVLNGIIRNNMYYLMGSAVTKLASLKQLNDNSTRIWHRRLRQVSLKSDQLLEGASTYHLISRDSCVLDKKIVKFGTVTHHLHGLLDCISVNVWSPTKTEAIDTLSLL